MLDFAVYLKRFASAFPHSWFVRIGGTANGGPITAAKPLLRNKIVIGKWKLRNWRWDIMKTKDEGVTRFSRGDRDEEENSDGSISFTTLNERWRHVELSWKARTPINARHCGMTSAMQTRRACTRVEIPGGSSIPKGKSVLLVIALPGISNSLKERPVTFFIRHKKIANLWWK